jgi:DNA-binding NarL/FixJ family response regulator
MRLLFVSGPSPSSDQVRRQLDQEHDVTVIQSHSGTVADIFAATARSAADVLFIDRDLTGSDGITVAHSVVRAGRDLTPPVIILASVHHGGDVARAAKAGVQGYLIGSQETWILNAAIRAVVSSAAWLCPVATGELLDEFRNATPRSPTALKHAQLTARERSVIRLIAQGRSNVEVAQELGVSVSAIKAHVSRMLAKLHLQRRAQLAVVARDLDIV